MRLSLPFLTSTLILTAIAHPVTVTVSPNEPHHPNPVVAAGAPLQDHQLQLLLMQESTPQRLVVAKPEREPLGWRAEKWAVAVRWWKGAVGGMMVEEDAGWSSGDGEDGVRVMEAIEEEDEEEGGEKEESECGMVDEDDEEEEDEEEDGQIEL